MGVISAFAIAKVRAYTESNMDGLVTVLRGGTGALDPVTGTVSGMTHSAPIYDGKARVHPVSGQGSLSVGPGTIDQRSTTVSIPWSADPVQRDDIILIRNAGQDGQLTGTALRVVEVAGGGKFGDARRMSCTLWGKSGYWSGTGAGATP